MVRAKPVELGTIDGKRYYLDPGTGKILWRIPDIREAVRAEPGKKVMSADYSQIEVRLMAYLSGDPWLIVAINSGKDIHCYMATDIFGAEKGFDYDLINTARKIDSHPRHDELVMVRNDIKVLVFGIPYGAGPPRVASETGKTIIEAEGLIDRYFEKAYVLKQWLEQQGRDALRYGFSTSPRGRKRFYIMPSADDKDAEQMIGQIQRWAGNHPIQAGNVDMLKPAMRMIYDRLRALKLTPEQARIAFVVHDEIVMSVLTELVDVVRPIMAESMQTAYLNIIPNIVNKIDVVVDDRWAKA